MSDLEVHFFNFNIADYERDTLDLTDAQHGAYLKMMLLAYKARGKPITLDLDAIYRASGAATEAERDARVWVLKRFFIHTPKGWVHKRIAAEVKGIIARRTHAKASSQKAAKSRWDKEKNAARIADRIPEQRTKNKEQERERDELSLSAKSHPGENPPGSSTENSTRRSPQNHAPKVLTRCVQFLTESGITPAVANRTTEALAETYTDDELTVAIDAASAKAPRNPIAYLKAVLTSRRTENGRAPSKPTKHPLGIFGQIASELRNGDPVEGPVRPRARRARND